MSARASGIRGPVTALLSAAIAVALSTGAFAAAAPTSTTATTAEATSADVAADSAADAAADASLGAEGGECRGPDQPTLDDQKYVIGGLLDLAQRVADAIIAGDQPSHGLLGASVVDSSQDTDDDRNVAGGLVVDLSADGAAEQAGLKPGDVITAVNGIPAVDGTSVSALVRMNEGGSTVTIDYSRGGKAGQVEATLGNLEW